MRTIVMIAGALAVAGLAAPVSAKPGKGHGAAAHSGAKAKGPRADADWRGRRDRDGSYEREEANERKYGGASCPPGLARKTPACVPPGQAKRNFSEGQRMPASYRYYTPYGDIPQDVRDRYDLDDDDRYIVRDNRITVVDGRTNLVRRVIEGLF